MKTSRKAQRLFKDCPTSSAALQCGKARPERWRTRLLSTIFLALLVSAASAAQPEAVRCLAPKVPITNLPAAVLAEYRTEIVAEFETYFAELSDHIACLDRERSRALSEARLAAEDYSAFLKISPTQKDRP